MIAKETTVNSDLIYTGKTIQLRVDTVEVPNKGYQKREIIEHKGSVAIVAITNDNNKVWYQEKYAIAKLIAPSIFKKYEEGDISAIKEYLQSTQEGNLKDALLTIGIENNKNGIEVLFKNLQEEEMLSREQNEKADE